MALPEKEVVNLQFGFWLVERVKPKQRGLPRLCVCLCTACGRRKLVRKTNLLSGRTSHCGCRSVRDLTGLRVGRLRVLRQAAEKEFPHAGAAWECQCDCGRRCIVRGAYLIRPKRPARSCGCTRQRKPARQRAEPVIRCEAYRPGLDPHGHRRVAVGEVIDIKASLFCSSWLRRVPPSTPLGTAAETLDEPLQTTSAQSALDREAEVLRAFGVTSASRAHEDDDVNYGRAIVLDDVPEEE